MLVQSSGPALPQKRKDVCHAGDWESEPSSSSVHFSCHGKSTFRLAVLPFFFPLALHWSLLILVIPLSLPGPAMADAFLADPNQNLGRSSGTLQVGRVLGSLEPQPCLCCVLPRIRVVFSREQLDEMPAFVIHVDFANCCEGDAAKPL